MTKSNELKGQRFDCIPLDWDSEYFGIKSARVNLKDEVTVEEQDIIIEWCKAYSFVTINNLMNNKLNNCWIGKRTPANLTDVNIQFTKTVKSSSLNDENTTIQNNLPLDPELLEIAKTSFKYSRFFNDDKLPQTEAQEIYYKWTLSSFNNESKYFVISKQDNNIAGFILFSMNTESHSAVIELIAVKSAYQGAGVGKKMMSKLENYLVDQDVIQLKVGTQIDNIGAIQFYNRSGFLLTMGNTVYHLWV